MPILSAQDFNNNFNQGNKVNLFVKGKGNQRILHFYFQKPDFITINDKNEDINNEMTYTFTKDNNSVIMEWIYPLPTGKDMFKDINCITTIDFSNFGPSEISDMSGMFSGYSALKSINFKNLDTSSVTDMSSMFYDTSIISLDLSKFNTSKVQNMKEMFSFAQNLETVILSNFDTSSVTNMDKMFYYASSLTLLNLTNFDISSVTSMNLMFKECNSLKYLNLISFKERNDIEASTLFSDNIVNLTYCLDKNISPKINENLESKNASNNCENICFTNSKFIPKKIQ